MASLIALFYNWWNLYVRFYDEGHHREAITSRPALMQGGARQVQGGGQRTIKVSLLHQRKGCHRGACQPHLQAAVWINDPPGRFHAPVSPA